MMKMNLVGASILCSMLFGGPSSVQAQEAKDGQWMAGFGAFAVSNPYAGAEDDYDFGAFPYFAYESNWLSFDPSGIEATVMQVSNEASSFGAEVGLILAPRWQLNDLDNSPLTEDLSRDVGVDAGIRLAAQLPLTSSSVLQGAVEYRGDISGESKGHEVDLSLGLGVQPNERLSIEAATGVYWRDDNLATYLYGVYTDEELLDTVGAPTQVRAAYEFGSNALDLGTGVTVPYVGVQGMYAMTPKVIAIAGLQAEFFNDDITDSPIIEEDNATSTFIGVLYKFD